MSARTAISASPVQSPAEAEPADAASETRRSWLTPWHLVVGLVLPMALLVANMARVHAFTVDDAYISFRYARNLAGGLGLVYNPGEYVEGYTNFLWTVLLGAGILIDLNPERLAKVLGGLAACGSLALVYLLSARLRPFSVVPCIATWLMATSIVQSGYAMFGLETPLFTFLVLAALVLFLNERGRPEAFPYSGIVFALAGLTRPEAPMYIGIPMLLLGPRRFVERQNVLRGLLFAGPVAAHVLWRQWYYGAWLPNTLAAKTGNLWQQLRTGRNYLFGYVEHASLVVILASVGVGVLLWCTWTIGARYTRSGQVRHLLQSDTVCLGALAAGILAYVMLVGGDWMPYYRFLAAFEPIGFVFACVALRWLYGPLAAPAPGRLTWLPGRARLVTAAVAACAFLAVLAVFRADRLMAAEQRLMQDEKVFWDSAAGGVAYWLVNEGQPGEVAVGDIGFIGYATGYPVLDLLGLVDPVISTLPGGYTNKTGPEYVERVFERSPAYFVFVGGPDCRRMAFQAQEKLRLDSRFQRSYRLAGQVLHSKDGYWCIFAQSPPAARADPSTSQAPAFTAPD